MLGRGLRGDRRYQGQVGAIAELVNKGEKQTQELLLEPRGELSAGGLTEAWPGGGGIWNPGCSGNERGAGRAGKRVRIQGEVGRRISGSLA